MNDVERLAWAQAVSNGDFICVETYSGYRSSRRDPQGEQFLLACDVGDAELGNAVLCALASSRFVSPLEDAALFDSEEVLRRYEEWTANLMRLYGYSTKQALFKKMNNCNIECRSGTITIAPCKHEKLEAWSGDGIAEKDRVVIEATSTPQDIGGALKKAFRRCR